ncbi:MAG: DUF6458 family protein [Actinomycetota bacterium]|nr:DUF6458 family protein [Actinomycetota bacterium]
MYIGTSIFLIALGAILKFAVTATVGGFEIQTAGVILIVVGLIGLVISMLMLSMRRDRRDDEVVPVVTERERRY